MRRALRFVPAAVVVAALVAALAGRWPWPRLLSAAPIVVESPWVTTTDTLHDGETLSALFARNGISGLSFERVSQELALDLRKLRPGTGFTFRRTPAESLPSRVLFRTDPTRDLALEHSDSGWFGTAIPIDWRPETVRVDGSIENSLYLALDDHVPDSVLDAGERIKLAWDLADIYQWQVDFTRDLRAGDHFTVALERLVAPDGEVRYGRVLAGDLVVDGKHLTAYHFDNADGTVGFFDDQGRSLRRAFLIAPLQFRRISSSFSRSRFHPILGIWRHHEGTDYAADYGTPVRAAGNGMVLRAGRYGGYGNLIELRHANGITTRYGHLSRFAGGIRPGVRVTQGETIGFVGATGLATGPHLHYEFRVNGVARDPRRMDLGTGDPVPAKDRTVFQAERARLAALLQVSAPTGTLAAASR
ncbi:MAG TPA: peptidoglycan DD-metalloendopeptidase family protein [Gemmatimonadales bacterium]|nr:peptidoglycan DD-metalloendopeptidase family protein [Gemmatimonadales bacterium]